MQPEDLLMQRRRTDAPASVLPSLRPLAMACVGLGVAAQALAQSDGGGSVRLLALEPRLSVQQTFTDSHQPSSALSAADAITRITAGLGWRGRSGALLGYLDYALTGVAYARHSDSNDLQNSLSANVAAELIEDRLQLLGSAAIARSAISAFGVQPGGSGDNGSNVTETRTLRVAPTLNGPLGRSVRYKATLAHSLTNSSGSAQGDSTATTADLHLEPAERARLGWTVDASSLVSDFKQGRRTRSDRLYGGIGLDLPAFDLQLSARVGGESTDIVAIERRGYTTWGLGLRWTPSPVARFEIDIDERFFGRAHQIVAEYRLPRTVLGLRSARALSTSSSQLVGQRGTLFNAAFNDPQNVDLQPDPVLRDALVRQYLLSRGLDPNTQANVGALRSAATLQDQLELSALWTGVRQSVMLLVSRNSTRRVDALSSAVDDLALVDRVRTSQLMLNIGHRLTPMATLALQLSTQRSSSGRDDLFNRQTQVELQWQTRLTSDSTVNASLRRARYTNGLHSDDETALTASYGVRF